MQRRQESNRMQNEMEEKIHTITIGEEAEQTGQHGGH